MKLMKKVFSLLLVVTILAAFIVPVSAATFSGGKGTSRNPYIITTAEQLNAMRDNLSAHYKLGANIDLSGISNWKAVGTWKAPFTGSLTCDTDSSGKPLYAISNLKCTVTPPNYDSEDYRYEDFKADGSSGWESGLFGVTNKATFSNIILLNVKVTNYAQGRSQQQMYKGQVVNNPVWQMCCGGFVGTMISSKATNCGVTGLVTGTSNHMGGFAGNIAGGSVVKQCYAIVDVKGGGEWYTGGFVGNTKTEGEDAKLIPHSGTPTISECYCEGWVSGSWCNTGGFVGGSGKDQAVFSDCYNRGTTDDPSSGRSFFGQDPKNTMQGCEVNFTNCYSLAGLAGKDKASTTKAKKDCFVGVEKDANGNYPYQNGFTAADKATINAYFKNNSLWTVTDGSYPTLKNVHIIKSLSELGKADDTQTTTAAGGSSTATTAASNNGGSSTATTAASGNAGSSTATTAASGNAGSSTATTAASGNAGSADETVAVDATAAEGSDDIGSDDIGTDETAAIGDAVVDGDAAADGSTDVDGATDETAGEADYSINTTVYDNTAQMTTAEFILVIVLLSIIGITLIGSIVTIILMLVHLKKNK